MLREDSQSREDITEVTFNPVSRLLFDDTCCIPNTYSSFYSLSYSMCFFTGNYLSSSLDRLNSITGFAFFNQSSLLVSFQILTGTVKMGILGLICSSASSNDLSSSSIFNGKNDFLFTTTSSSIDSSSCYSFFSITFSSMSSSRLIIVIFVYLICSFAGFTIMRLLMDEVFPCGGPFCYSGGGKKRLYLGVGCQYYSKAGQMTVCDFLEWTDADTYSISWQ